MDLERKLSSIHEISKSLLSKIFALTINSKYLILETSVIKPLEKICGVKWLRSNGVEKIFKLEDSPSSFDSKAIYYIIYSNISTFKHVISQIRSSIDIENPPINKFHILVVPQSNHVFEKELEEFGLLNSGRDYIIRLHSLQWLPIHIDIGILSLEFPFTFSSLFIHHSSEYTPMFSKCLWHLMLILGKINFTLALGNVSNIVLRQYEVLHQERGGNDKVDTDIGGLIILDRNQDYQSTLLTPGIYSALLKETYKVAAGYCEEKLSDSLIVDSKFNRVLNKDPVTINLDSELDAVYGMTKNKYFTEVTSVLSNLTKELKMEKMNSKDMSIDEIKKYVQTQLGLTNSRKKLIANHLIAAETIIKCLGWRFEKLCDTEFNIMNNVSKANNFNFLMELMCIENNEFISLRLFCLLLITQRLTESEINSFWEKFLHQFGFKYIYALQHLSSAGILSDISISASSYLSSIKLAKLNTNQFYTNAHRLKQIPSDADKIDFKYPTCMSYVFRGTYIPLAAQIVSMVVNSISLEEIKSKLEGLGSLVIKNERGYPLQTRTMLVYFIGGVTYAEIGALNFIEALSGVKIIVLSDRIISGNDLMQDFLEVTK